MTRHAPVPDRLSRFWYDRGYSDGIIGGFCGGVAFAVVLWMAILVGRAMAGV